MHELSVAQSLIELLNDRLAADPPERVGTIRLAIGTLSGVVPQALLSAFGVAARGSLVEGAVLEVQEIHPRIWCAFCDAERDVRGVQSMRCIECGQPSSDLRAGRELLIMSVEVFHREPSNAAENS